MLLSSNSFRPPLKWAGGKRWLAPQIKDFWARGDYPRLVEPFAGGVAVAGAIAPHRALINDINPHLINFYRCLQAGLVIDLEAKNEAFYYYGCRDRFNYLIEHGLAQGTEAASLFYYLNRQGFNALCRFNQQGKFNVPFGRYKKFNGTKDLSAYAAAIKNWEFSCQDFAALTITAEDLVYADPPYDGGFTKYSSRDFTWEDQVRLAHWLKAIPATVIASNRATPRIVALYKELGFVLDFQLAPRRIASNGDRTPVRELIAVNR